MLGRWSRLIKPPSRLMATPTGARNALAKHLVDMAKQSERYVSVS
jgi:hypothetical protein